MPTIEETIAEMKVTNKRLGYLTQNLSGLAVDPLGGFQLGQDSPVGKRPFYADRTAHCDTADHGTTPIIFFDPPANVWTAIVWYSMLMGPTATEVILYKEQRVPGTGLPAPSIAKDDGVICDPRLLWGAFHARGQMYSNNLYPHAFLMSPEEALFIVAASSTGHFSATFGFTVGKFN